ncbi:MAG: DUF4276 family protein [Bacteroidia bacterium]
MVNVKMYVEGASGSKEQRIRTQRSFSTLLTKAGFGGRMPQLIACGGKQQAYDDFCTAMRGSSRQRKGQLSYPLLLVDSEDPLAELIEQTDHDFAWAHLHTRDRWKRPADSDSRQALLMATCMECWIAADRSSLSSYYGKEIAVQQLPPLHNLENRDRHDVLRSLQHATRTSKKPYAKGHVSFALLAEVNPVVLRQQLSQFRRMIAVLDEVLPAS